MKLKVNLSGMELDNPIIPASGTFGYGYEYMEFYDINMLGSFSSKAITLEKRFGNSNPRIADCDNGMLNSIGLQNPGVDDVINKEFVKLKKVYNKKIIANISGSTIEDYIECAKIISQEDVVGIIELNVSCPNVSEGGIAFGSDPVVLGKLVKKVKKVSAKPLYIKLSPNVTNIVQMAKICEDNGADGLVLINTLVGMRIDINKGKPVLANKVGGLSGPAIFPIALRMVYQVYKEVNIPIIGVGGIKNERDVIEMLMAGAHAVQIGSENLINPLCCKEIIQNLPDEINKLGYNSIKDLIGVAHE